MKRYRLYPPILLLFLFLLLPAPVMSQERNAELEKSLKEFFSSYKLPDFNPKLVIGLDHYETDDTNHTLQIYGNEGFASQTFTPAIVKDIYSRLPLKLPAPYNTYRLIIYGHDKEITTLIPNIYLENQDVKRLWGDLDYKGNPWMSNLSSPIIITKGLQNRHIGMWASHGRYFDSNLLSWKWQRPYLFCTTEDLFTESIVTPFLIPMLQNSGAIIYSPRERDWQTHEVIVDNDRPDTLGQYYERNRKEEWARSPRNGYAAIKATYFPYENPFCNGSARMINTTRLHAKASSCYWVPQIPEEGSYAVYVSYQTFPNSVSDAVYTVHHKGVSTRFRVNQQMGGGTWVYLGTFSFDKGEDVSNSVSLTNISDYRGIITADAVRFGGGMGNIARGETVGNEKVSGLPRFLEGALYAVQMAGFPDSTYDTKDGHNDYADDINSRSLSLNYLGGGSVYIPDSMGAKVPIELSVALHSDAGASRTNDVFGTLCISTLKNGHDEEVFKSGVSRLASSDLAGILQNTVCQDLSQLLQRTWTRRELFNRNYSETRLPEVPSAIVEMLSHQNFTDMRYGHDPNFKFFLARSIYKGILKFISNQHKTDYAVQPLPVKAFSALLQPNNTVELSWSPTVDSLESTAAPEGYVIYTRMDGEDFDNGTVIKGTTSFTAHIESNTIYSFKVTAFNKGGESFPSEILSVMKSPTEKSEVLIVNGFNRLSAPAVVDTEDSLGFDIHKDIGVAYQRTPEYSGAQECFDRRTAGREGVNGLGYSGQELQGKIIAGNSFDYPYVHGKAIQGAGGCSFSSCSMDAVRQGRVNMERYKAVDLILGLQKDDGLSSMVPYKTFDAISQTALLRYLERKGHLLVSGSYIASDMQSNDDRYFTTNSLKYAFEQNDSTLSDSIITGSNIRFSIVKDYNENNYAVTHPDRLAPVGKAYTAFTYADGSSAGTVYDGKDCKVVALGFPFESIRKAGDRESLMKAFLQLLTQ